MATLQSLLVKLGIDADDFRGGLGRAGASLKRFRDDVEKSSRGIATFGDALSSIGRPAVFGALASGATSLTAAVLPAAGALGLIPGAAASGGAAMGTLTVAMTGFGDAMKNMGDPAKFAEALAKLSPAARQSAVAVHDLVPAWEKLTSSVQDAAFAGVSQQIKQLGGKYIPILQSGMTGIATQFNTAATAVGNFASSATAVTAVKTILTATKTVVSNLAAAAVPLVAAFTDIAAVGSKVFAELTAGAGRAAQRFADFIATARQTGQLEDWIRGGIEVLKKLGQIAGNVGSAIMSIFKAAGDAGDGFLDTLVQLTSQFSAWASSAEGQKKLNQIFTLFNSVLESLATILPILGGALSTVAGIITALPAPVQGLITGFLGTSVVVGALTKKFAPLIAVLGKLTGKLVTSAVTQGAAVNRMLKGLNRLGAGLGKGIGKLGAFTGKVVASFTRVATVAAAKSASMAAGVIGKFATMSAKAMASMAKMAAKVVAKWVIMAAGAMARAAVMAAAWVVAMGPVGWVTAAIVALVALIIANWDKVKKWTVKIWNAIWGWIKKAWKWIVDKVTGAAKAVWHAVKNGVSNAYHAVTSWLGKALNWIAGLPGRILSALGNLGKLLWNAGKDIIGGLWNGLLSMGKWLMNKILGFLKSFIPGPILDFFGIGSPSKLMADIAKWIPEGIAVGIEGNTSAVEKAVGNVSDKIAAMTMPIPEVPDWQQRGQAEQPVMQVTINNPVAEKASDTLQRRMRNIAELGMFAGAEQGAAA